MPYSKRSVLSLLSGSKSNLASMALVAAIVSGCGGNTPSATPVTQQVPQTYMAPYVSATTTGGSNLLATQTYTIDDVGDAFKQTIYGLDPPLREGAQLINVGTFNPIATRGLLGLEVIANYVPSSNGTAVNTNPLTGGFAIESAGQAAGLVQLPGQPVAPLVAALSCPSNATPQTYLFVTIPQWYPGPTAPLGFPSWNPATDTAYGIVDISASGSTVTFDKIKQFTFPVAGVSATPTPPGPSSNTGACGPTQYGNTISIPAQVVVTNPTSTGQGTPAPQAIVGIAPNSMLAEDNGLNLTYENTLGAGTGSVGLPRSSSPLDTAKVVGAQYLGFVYGAGLSSGNLVQPPSGWSSHLVSFGFSSVPSTCASVVLSSSTLIYGGDFTNDDPSKSTDGFGNCNLAIDLGPQDAANNGLYSSAKIWMGGGYRANTSKATYSFPAVAIAGLLDGKFAIFLLGKDTSQPWAIYLLQSN